MELKPYAFTPYLQASVAIAALLIGASAMFATFSVWRGERNARLVEIRIGVLRADPAKEPTALAARQWAMDLIDANAGGVRFSADARRELLNKPFASAALSHGDVTNLFSGWDSTHVKPIDKSAPRTP